MAEPVSVEIEGWSCRENHGDMYAADGHTSYKLDEDGLSVAAEPGWFPAQLPRSVLSWMLTGGRDG